jgi:hypothetical protein
MNADAFGVIDREALRQAAQSFAASGEFADWREVLKEMLRRSHFGSATLFLDRDIVDEIDAICHQARRKARAQSTKTKRRARTARVTRLANSS